MGGFSSHQIDHEKIEKSENLLQEANENNTEHSQQFFSASPQDTKESRTLIFYSSQVVNGTNYRMIYKLNDNFACVKMYKSLPYTGEKAKMQSFYDGSKKEACSDCYANTGLEDECAETITDM